MNSNKNKMTPEEQIEEIMDFFDFSKAAEIMEAIGWRWHNGAESPTEYDLRKEARRMLKGLVASAGRYVTFPGGLSSSSGGLTATASQDPDDGWIRLDLYFGLDTVVLDYEHDDS